MTVDRSSRTPRSGVVWDVAIGLTVGAGGGVVLALLAGTDWWYPYPQVLRGYQLALATLGAVLALRRRAPMLGALVALLLYPLVQNHWPVALIHQLPIVLAAFVLVRSGRLHGAKTLVWALLSTLLLFSHSLQVPLGLVVGLTGLDRFFGVPGWGVLGSIDLSEMVQQMAVAVFAVVLGQTMRHLAETRSELEQRNAELLALQGVEAERAVTAERNRISRDLHDIVAHHVTAIVVRAQAVLHISSAKPEAARDALSWIVDEGKQSLAAMREMVAVLRADAEGGDLDESLRKVADRLRGGGLDVQLEIQGSLPRIPAAVHEAALRIAQEALTNVALHSGADAASLVVQAAPGTLTITVTDPGPAVVPEDEDEEREGNGLRHMRERAEGVGGTLRAGQLGDGWRVAAHLPIGQGKIET